MTTYTFPSITPNATRTELLSNTSVFISPITGATQTLDRGGERWQMTMTFTNLTGANRADLQAYLAKLNGQQHRLSVPNHAEANRGAFGGTPLVKGASQTGNSLNVDGCSLTVTNWIRAGDWFGVNGELKLCTADASSDGAGDITISFVPRLRAAPSDNAAITTSGATGTFILSQPNVSWSDRPGGLSDLTVSCVEDIT